MILTLLIAFQADAPGTAKPPPILSATASVAILDTAFAIPQLGRTRRIRLHLRPGYATSHRRYPALYMHDRQNLFDAATSFAGEWGVDETLDRLHALGDEGAIVVGIDNGEKRRMDEYSPWSSPKSSGGEGDAYVDFLVKTLKPYIDAHYRTESNRLHTGIMVMGGQEGDTPERYVADFQNMVDTLRAAGFAAGAIRTAVRPDGKHAEWSWRREFPAAYRWLFDEPPPAPAWTPGAVCYEVFVRSFYDSNGDGIGDLNGLIQKLDYINGLGASCLWLMPVAASPSYHGYDVGDYYRVEPAYGTNDDFKRMVEEAHRRGIKVLVDMVLNHSSSEHPHFQEALRDTASPYRAWYRWAPTPPGKGPHGGDDWHHSPVRDEYYYGVFWSGMPDLNYQTPAVRDEAKRIATFWLREMDVDGFRLDAVPYLVEEGTCLMGCPGTHAFLHEYAAHVDSVKPGAYTVGEAWGNIDAMMPYYPDQLTSYFGFELADSLLSVVRTGSAAGLLPGFLRLQDTLPAYRWSPFLSNHDQTRVLTALGGDVARAKLAATLLLTLPGLPFVYYGEEIGMTGDKPDPRLRTPMQWAARPGAGFTTGTPWESLQPDSLTTTVAAQDGDPRSLLNLYRRLIHLRRANDALGTGTLVPLSASNLHVAAYLRRVEGRGGRSVVVLANLDSVAASGVAISSSDSVLAPGPYAARNLLGGPDAARLRVSSDGRIRGYAPGTLGPRASLVLDLMRR